MKTDGRDPSPTKRCAAGEAIEILQEKWVLHIVRSLLQGDKGFNALGREVGGCNPTTLTQRLCRLESLGLVTKTVHSVTPPRCSYALTPSGRALDHVIASIQSWAHDHLPGGNGAAGGEGDPGGGSVVGPRTGSADVVGPGDAGSAAGRKAARPRSDLGGDDRR